MTTRPDVVSTRRCQRSADPRDAPEPSRGRASRTWSVRSWLDLTARSWPALTRTRRRPARRHRRRACPLLPRARSRGGSRRASLAPRRQESRRRRRSQGAPTSRHSAISSAVLQTARPGCFARMTAARRTSTSASLLVTDAGSRPARKRCSRRPVSASVVVFEPAAVASAGRSRSSGRCASATSPALSRRSSLSSGSAVRRATGVPSRVTAIVSPARHGEWLPSARRVARECPYAPFWPRDATQAVSGPAP